MILQKKQLIHVNGALTGFKRLEQNGSGVGPEL